MNSANTFGKIISSKIQKASATVPIPTNAKIYLKDTRAISIKIMMVKKISAAVEKLLIKIRKQTTPETPVIQ